jgi:hypothetical protein
MRGNRVDREAQAQSDTFFARMAPPAFGDTAHRDMPISDIIARARHDGCGGRARKVELSTAVWRIVLRAY